MRLLRSGLLAALLAWGAQPLVVVHSAAAADQAQPARDQMFSGTVTEIAADSLTAVRVGQGKSPTTKTFLLTPETRFEGGKPRVNARVTVRYVTTDDGDRAIHVIVRGAAKK